MSDVVFVLPYAMDTSLRFARAASRLDGVRMGVVSQEPAWRLPEDLRSRLAGFQRVEDAMDAAQLTEGVRALARGWGGRVDALVGILEQLQVPLAEVRETLSIRGMGVEEARNFRDKARMKAVLREHDLPCARSHLAETAADALDFASSIGYPLVVKPPAGAGAKNTLRVENDEQLTGYLRTLPPTAAEPVLLEEFITGKEHSFDSVSVGGRHVFHSVSRYFPTPLEVMESPWIQWAVMLPRDIDTPEYADIAETGRRALEALGMVSGLTHMEWFRREDGSLALSEVAARPPGAQFTTLLSYAHDFDFYRGWARLMAFEEFSPPERKYAVGAAYLRGQGRGRVRSVEGLDEIQREVGGLIVEAKLPRPGQPAASSYEGEGFLVLRHPDTETVEAGLAKVVSTIRVELG